MEIYLSHLLQASIGILLFYLVYYFVLRAETFYRSNRIFLLFGLALAILLPFVPLTYQSAMPFSSNSDFFYLTESAVSGIFQNQSETEVSASFFLFEPMTLLLIMYIIGLTFFGGRLIFQTLNVVLSLRKGRNMIIDGVQVIDLQNGTLPFSFFNVVFINIQEYSKEELSNVIAHEKVHIQERHWVDLLFIELLTVVFWMNPIVWLYEKSIKQNHEYLADQGVLLAGYHPGRYQALLINQLMGVKILGFTNNLNYSLNKKRMEMMKKEKTSTFNKVKLLIALPVVAVLAFAFAEPEYAMVEDYNESSSEQTLDKQDMISVTGSIKNEDGVPLAGANIVLKNTARGTVADLQGEFAIEIPNSGALVVSYIGYETTPVTITSSGANTGVVTVKMKKGVFNIKLPEITGKEMLDVPPPPPPSKKNNAGDEWTVVEDMPYYKKGGMHKFSWDIFKETEAIMNKTKDRGDVLVGFTITENGKVTSAHIVKKSNSDILNQSALKVVTKLDNWKPGVQRGKPVKVDLSVPINFN